jgi:1,4-alpha-glucan branching enzyme
LRSRADNAFQIPRLVFSLTTSAARAGGRSHAYHWRRSWKGREWEDVVVYELHVGAFHLRGTFAGAAHKLDHLADLRVTAVEIMPVSDFKGLWNWGL